MILGEDGTGKTLAARLIHDDSDRGSGPLIAVNCRDLAPGKAAELILGEDLGGSLPTGDHGSGGVQLAHGGTLVLRGADKLLPSVQQLLGAFLIRNKKRIPGSFPDTRVILTAREASAPSEGREGLVESITDVCDEVITLPPLVKRPKDIMPLAEEFLKRHGPDAPTITEGARQALLSLRYRRRNVAELREVMDLAVRVADGSEIRAEHIFGGVGDDAIPPGVDITDTPVMRRLLSRSGLPLLRAVTLLGFAASIVLCLAFPLTQAGNVANSVIWSVWEPAVFALFFLAGPVWCTICPLSSAARLAKKAKSLDRPPSAWIVQPRPLDRHRRFRSHRLGRARLRHPGKPRGVGIAPRRPHRPGGDIRDALQTRSLVPPSLPTGSSRHRSRSRFSPSAHRQAERLRLILHHPCLLQGHSRDLRLSGFPPPVGG